MLQSYRQEIRRETIRRNIQTLLHFTKVDNLPSIIDHGLMPRDDLESASYLFSATDIYRLDGRSNTVSLSISAVNYAMFASKRHAYPEADWVVLLLEPAILWTKACRFCERSAASKEMVAKRGAQAGVRSFRHLFIDECGIDHENFPARNDAEVLVYSQIETGYIRGAWTDRRDVALFVQDQLDRFSSEDLTTYLGSFD